MKLSDNIHTIPIERDSRRYSPERKLAFEVYGPFGRRIGLWSKNEPGTFPDRGDEREIAEAMRGDRRWIRLVTYGAPR